MSSKQDQSAAQPELSALLQSLGDDEKRARRRAVDTLASIAREDRNALEKIRDALGDSAPRIRWGAAYTLARAGDGALTLEALPAVLEAFADADGDIRWAAAELAVKLACPYPREVRDRLLETAAHGGAVARRMALYCIRDLKCTGAEVFAIIDRASRAGDPHARLAAMAALAKLGDARDGAAALALRLVQSDENRGVRRAAAITLGHIGNRSAPVLDALRRASIDSLDSSLARAARAALARLETRDGAQ